MELRGIAAECAGVDEWMVVGSSPKRMDEHSLTHTQSKSQCYLFLFCARTQCRAFVSLSLSLSPDVAKAANKPGQAGFCGKADRQDRNNGSV